MRSRIARGVWSIVLWVFVELLLGYLGWCPCRPYISGEQGYIEGVLVGYGIGVLVSCNCASCIQGRSDSIPTPTEASCSLAQQVVRVYPVWSRRPALPSVRVIVLGHHMDTRRDILHSSPQVLRS